MFSKTDGPTALRADLVQALSFSHDRIERIGGEATVSSLAALAGVWNGRKGHVALIVRDIEPAAIERYVGSIAILCEADLESAVEEGIAFAESLGFSMDSPEFQMLSPEGRESRIYRWNKLRKVRQPASVGSEGASAAPSPEPEDLDPPQVPTGYEIELQDLARPSSPPGLDLSGEYLGRAPTEEPGLESGASGVNAASAVLGRISLVRRGGSDARRLELIARLLASY